MKILIITSCTGQKAASCANHLTMADFRAGADHIAKREAELAEHVMPADELYTGLQHQRLMRAVREVRSSHQGNGSPDFLELDVWILSAGYGLIPGARPIAPYEATFQGMKAAELRAWAEQLNVPKQTRELLVRPFDLGLVLLGDAYLKACALGADVQLGGPVIAFCGQQGVKSLAQVSGLRPVILTNAEARRFSCALVALKGELAGRALRELQSKPDRLADLNRPETDLLSRLGATKSDGGAPQAVRGTRSTPVANPRVDVVISLPVSWTNKPHRERLRYIIPEWDDLVDPEYDFENDMHSGGSSDWSNEVYAHQLYPEPNYDGILVSKVVAEKSQKKKQRINALGVHRYLRVPRQFPVMGDCGAFGYITEEFPPYTTDEIIDYYTRLDFDYGVSVDHLIVAATEDQKKQRYELTIHNANEFIRAHRSAGLPWVPVGAVQGWDPQSYTEAAAKYVAMGYRYIALGGLVRSSTADIIRVLAEVNKVVPDTVSVHLFGLARLKGISEFARLGVRSVDSASYLRQAWMRGAQGYLTDNGPYASLRIPEAGKSFRAKQMVERGVSETLVRRMEQDALRAVRALARNEESVENCLAALLDYDRHMGIDRVDMSELYRKTLLARPWETCDCAVCKACGVEVVIFRGNNRNRRRGFHNTYVFYRMLQRILLGEVSVDALNLSGTPTEQLPLFAPGGACQ